MVIHDGKPYRYSGYGDQHVGKPTVVARLVALYLSAPCALSVAELARDLVPHVKLKNACRQIERAHVLIRATYADRFVEDEQAWGDTLVAPRRYIKPGVDGLSVVAPRLRRRVDLRALSQQAKADPARSRTRAPRSTRPSPERARQPARKHGVTNPPILAPIAYEEAVLAAVRAKHGQYAAADVLRDLCRPRCHREPDAARLALRTLAARDTETPLKLFRYLFGCAVGGDPLVDKPKEADRTVAAELEGVTGGATLAELEARLAAVHMSGDVERVRVLEAAIRKLTGITPPDTPPKPLPVPRPTPPPAPPTHEPSPERIARGAAYVQSLPEHLRKLFQRGDTS